MQSLLLPLRPSLPHRTSLQPISIRVKASDKTRPICLGDRHDRRVRGGVRNRCIASGVFRTPDGVDFDGVGDSATGGCSDGINDIPVVIPNILAGKGGSVDVRDVDARAIVSELAICIRSLPPPRPRVREYIGCIVRIQSVDLLELRSCEQGELVFEESVAFADAAGVCGDEDGAFVCVVAVDGGEFDEVAFAVGGHGEVTYDVVVESGSVHVEGRVLSAGERSVDVLGLEVCCVEAAKAGQRVLGVYATGTDDQVVVHELRFIDAADGGERLRLGDCGVEETVVAAVVCSKQKGDGCSTC